MSDRFSADLKQGVLSEAAQRRCELRAMGCALDREETSFVEAKDAIDTVLQWIVNANETALFELRFEALRARHDRLDGFHDRCETIVRKRQSLLHATTSADAQVGIAHQEFVKCLYVAFPVSCPSFRRSSGSTKSVTQCQQAIRDHLVRLV